MGDWLNDKSLLPSLRLNGKWLIIRIVASFYFCQLANAGFPLLGMAQLGLIRNHSFLVFLCLSCGYYLVLFWVSTQSRFQVSGANTKRWNENTADHWWVRETQISCIMTPNCNCILKTEFIYLFADPDFKKCQPVKWRCGKLMKCRCSCLDGNERISKGSISSIVPVFVSR